jgi:soluble lytic murein transglycosylase-like protein
MAIPLHKKLFGWLHATHFVATLAIVVGGGFLAFIVYEATSAISEMRDEQRSIVAYVRLLREEAAVREIVVEKLPKLDIDAQARLAFEIYDGARRNGIPSWLILAIIDQESTWGLDATSKAGAVGLMQLMPATGIAYARMNGIPQSIESFRDPVINVRLCIQVLADNYQASVLADRSPKGDYTRALWLYNGRGEDYARRVMEKASKYQKRLNEAV